MAYKKTYGRRKRKNTKKAKGLGDYTLTETANFAARGVKSILRVINVEYKHHDIILGSNVTGTAAINDLSSIPLGDASTDRDGISIKPLNLSYRVNYVKSSVPTSQMLRMIIFRGKQENTVTPVAGDVLQNTTGTGSILSFKNYDKRFKTKILYDKIITFDDANKNRQYMSGTIRLNGHINYDISDTTGAQKETGGLYILLVNSDATNPISSLQHYRLTYTDN